MLKTLEFHFLINDLSYYLKVLFYLQKKKYSFHIVLWNAISQKCLLETKEQIINPTNQTEQNA
jgi:hypothetical protein